MIGTPVVIGIGNLDRGDDAIGRHVARRLRERCCGSCDIVEARGEASELLELLEGRAAAILIDACVSGAPAGAIRELDMSGSRAPDKGAEMSSHGLGLAQAIELARALGVLPTYCIVLTIEAVSFAHGAAMTPDVAVAVDAAVERAKSTLDELARA